MNPSEFYIFSHVNCSLFLSLNNLSDINFTSYTQPKLCQVPRSHWYQTLVADMYWVGDCFYQAHAHGKSIGKQASFRLATHGTHGTVVALSETSVAYELFKSRH